MLKRRKQKYIGVDYANDTLIGLLTGKCRIELPKDAEILHVRAGEMFSIAEFLVRSKEYAELETGAVMPTENPSYETIVSVSTQHAYSLSELVKYFKKMIEQGHIPDTPSRNNELTAGYCDELLEDLKV